MNNWPDQLIDSHAQLALFLQGDETSFTGDLLRLIAKADNENTDKLRSVYPHHVMAYHLWMKIQPYPTFSQMKHIIDGICMCSSHSMKDPEHPCRIMPTRKCPPIYAGICGDRPCARFESEDPTPWAAI